jgi:hypothetical protein
LIVSTLNRKHGCIISYGTWFSSGTCATFRSESLSGSYMIYAYNVSNVYQVLT